MRLMKVEMREEIKMIWCFEVTLYQSHKSQKKAEEVSVQIYTSAPVSVQARPSLILSHSTHTCIFGNKKKRTRLYFYTSVLLSFLAIHLQFLLTGLTSIYTHTHLYVHIHIYTYTHIYIYIYIYISPYIYIVVLLCSLWINTLGKGMKPLIARPIMG